ncbi:amidase family protein [Mycoplasmopsis meleagridis]|uniref:amidase family protein n=1 Tax=Mycoplasmopsis meleagridis TaxID=29561 RepID=UPI00073D1F98|nr:amidase family protein [Mycoplasmopsis meleagridis]KUH47626.1 amidase [Mycoplasmopsis meleagridis]
MELIEKGNWNKASLELKNDQNNAVVDILDKFQYKQKTNDLLKDAVFTIKDNFATSFSKSTASSNFLKNFFPSYNATAIEKLLIAGALPIAKVNCDELALGGTGTFSANGLIKNPLDETRLAGGSSSGSVATLTKNISFALASDTGDSVRLPASYNGKVGFKPSYGAISRYGLFAYASSLDTVAYFAHNVNDISIISQVLYGKDDKDFTSIDVKIDNIAIKKPKKIAFLNTKKINEKLYENFISLYKNLNSDKEIKIDLIEPNITILKAIKPTYDVISYSEASSNLSNLNGIAFGERINGNNWNETMTNSRSKGFGYMVQRRLTLGSFFLYSENQAEIFIKAQKARRVIKNYLDDLHSKYDIVIFPASADVAPLIKGENKNYDYMEYILTGDNLVGNPSITIPFMRINNLPINLAISSKIYSDENLLSFALWIEKYLKDTKYE